MTSLSRKFRRARFGKDKFEELFPRPNPVMVTNPDGGYTVLHPTRGFKTVSGARVRLYGSGQ